MDPISAINGLMTTVKGAYSALTAVNSLKSELSNLDVRMKLRDALNELVGVEEQLLDIRRQVLALTEENDKLKAENTKLKSNVPEVDLRDGNYYSATDPNDGPFCTTCFDQSKKRVRLTDRKGTPFGALGRWKCNGCGAQSGPTAM